MNISIGLIILAVVITSLIAWSIVTINNKETNHQQPVIQPSSSLNLSYEQLFRFLDVIIVNEVKNFISINNTSNKDSSVLSVGMDESIIELSTKIYSKCMSEVILKEFNKYVKEEFLMEYISRSVRNNLVAGSYKK